MFFPVPRTILLYGPFFLVQLLFYPIGTFWRLEMMGLGKGGPMALKIHVHMDVTISNTMVGAKLKNRFSEQSRKRERKPVLEG